MSRVHVAYKETNLIQLDPVETWGLVALIFLAALGFVWMAKWIDTFVEQVTMGDDR